MTYDKHKQRYKLYNARARAREGCSGKSLQLTFRVTGMRGKETDLLVVDYFGSVND
jgi:RNA:NAD 2'-phosphotransferase (TPT1/KptA family)